MVTCPNCHLQVPELIHVASALREKIMKVDPHYPLEEMVCKPCQNSLMRQATSATGALVAQERAKEVRKKRLWQNRVALVRHGHKMMKKKKFTEAAVSYEKYMRLIEVVFECAPGSLTPEMLKDASKTAELTVITGVYWDLVRIYDSSDKYTPRQKNAAKQLAKFASFTPIFLTLIRNATSFMKQSRHPEVIKSFLVAANAKRNRCFVATSAFETPMADEIIFLRQFRDTKLKTNPTGRSFVYLYYKISPSLACFLDKQSWLKPTIRAILRLVIYCVSRF
ncbi:MAG: CFI-box-CTERM domain-containing protein [Pseudobdellovibrio sp.]